MKIIFLDIDGVLVTRDSLIAAERRVKASHFTEERRDYCADSACVAQLNRILAATGAKIVVSSTWRHAFGDCNVWLKKWGVTSRSIGHTPRSYSGGPRGSEIAHWLADRTDVTRFVILDDDSDMGPLLPLLVKTSMDGGLREEHADRAIAILNQR